MKNTLFFCILCRRGGLPSSSLAESLYNFWSTLVAFRSFILCFIDGYNKALCNDELYLVKGGPASGSIILMLVNLIVMLKLSYVPLAIGSSAPEKLFS